MGRKSIESNTLRYDWYEFQAATPTAPNRTIKRVRSAVLTTDSGTAIADSRTRIADSGCATALPCKKSGSCAPHLILAHLAD